MPTIIEVNVQTNERTEREMTPDEVAAYASMEAETVPPTVVDPVDKLKSFLAANPDVAALLTQGASA